jgi:hypothetical protein
MRKATISLVCLSARIFIKINILGFLGTLLRKYVLLKYDKDNG